MDRYLRAPVPGGVLVRELGPDAVEFLSRPQRDGLGCATVAAAVSSLVFIPLTWHLAHLWLAKSPKAPELWFLVATAACAVLPIIAVVARRLASTTVRVDADSLRVAFDIGFLRRRVIVRRAEIRRVILLCPDLTPTPVHRLRVLLVTTRGWRNFHLGEPPTQRWFARGLADWAGVALEKLTASELYREPA